MIDLPMPTFRIPASTPLVSRSAMLRGDEVIVMDGAQFEDDRRRIVVGQTVSDDTIRSLEKALVDMEGIDGMRRWISDLLAKPSSGDPS